MFPVITEEKGVPTYPAEDIVRVSFQTSGQVIPTLQEKPILSDINNCFSFIVAVSVLYATSLTQNDLKAHTESLS